MKKILFAYCLASSVLNLSFAAESSTPIYAAPTISGLESSVLDPATIQKLIDKGRELFIYLQENAGSMVLKEDWKEIEELLQPFLSEATYSKTYENYSPSLWARGWFASDDPVYNETRKSYLYGMIALTWYFKYLAFQQKEGFDRGSFSLIDPKKTIYNFLISYVDLVNDTTEPENLPYAGTLSNYAYRRDPKLYGSSHHVNQSSSSQFGIDIRLETNHGILMLLPNDHTHILFGELDLKTDEKLPVIFFKTEPVGMGTIGAAVVHGSNYNGGGEHKPTDRREKDLPHALKDAYNQFYKDTPHGEEKKITVYEMIQQANRILHNEEMEQYANYLPAAKKFLEKVDEIFPYGSNEVRTGNEVILDLGKYKQ